MGHRALIPHNELTPFQGVSFIRALLMLKVAESDDVKLNSRLKAVFAVLPPGRRVEAIPEDATDKAISFFCRTKRRFVTSVVPVLARRTNHLKENGVKMVF